VTCQKGKAWLSQHGYEFTFRHLEKEPLTAAELTTIAGRLQVPVQKLLNPKSTTLKKLAVTPDNLSEEAALELIAAYPKALFRPIVVSEAKILLGFKEDQFAGL